MDKLELLTEQYKNCCAENDALKAENARYREALEFCAEQVIWHDEKNQDVILTYGYCVNRAREALKGTT
jgi:hypothetical protein